MTRLAPLALMGALCACDVATLQSTQLAASYAASQIEIWNAAGVNPISADDETRARILIACGSIGGFYAVARPHDPQAQDALADFCALALQAAR